MQQLYPAPDPLSLGGGVRELAWWTGSQLEAIAEPVARAWSAWTQGWVRDTHAGTAPVECAQAHERSERKDAHWVPLGRRGSAAAWIEVRTDADADVLEEIFGADAGASSRTAGPEGIAQSIAARAWTELANSLRETLALDPAELAGPAADSFKVWSGCVVVSTPGSRRMPRNLLLNAECVRALLASQGRGVAAPASWPRMTLTPLAHALVDRKLPIRVELSACELDLGSLQGLRVGDIIPLPHSLDAPLLVSTTQEIPVCAGFLGRQGGFKAIELVREAHADHHP